MKFAYVDESGDQGQGDAFVMAGVLVDAYRLRKYAVKFDEMIAAFLTKHPGAPKELKTKNFINGVGGWSKVDPEERKKFLSQICSLIAECSKIFGVAFSFELFNAALNGGYGQPFEGDHWLGAALFVAALVQKKMQTERGNKGLTVLICDDNKQGMPKLADALYDSNPWLDPIYQTSTRRRGETVWEEISNDERFDQIVNCAFAIKSQHSSLIQVADVVCYVYRRHLELKSDAEAWPGEKKYFGELAVKLDSKRESLGRTPGGPCIEFYKAACHVGWAL
jgi:Protein of unknown function (DUF3800)